MGLYAHNVMTFGGAPVQLAWREVSKFFLPSTTSFLKSFFIGEAALTAMVRQVALAGAVLRDELCTRHVCLRSLTIPVAADGGDKEVVPSALITAAAADWASSNADTIAAWMAVPTVTSVAPVHGPTAGGQVVVITGTGFGTMAPPVVSASIGSVPCSSARWVSATEIQCTTPPGGCRVCR